MAAARPAVLGLGAPLWVPAPPHARVALLAHELGHFAHGDLTHGWWVGTAQQTLLHWLDVLTENRTMGDDGVELLQRYAFAPLRGLVIAYLALIAWVDSPASQRQEFLADLDAMEVAGTEGVVALLDLTLCDGLVSTAITRAALDRARPDVWEVLDSAVRTTDDESRARRRAHAAPEGTRIDDSHPATVLRLELVSSLRHREPRVVLSEERLRALDAELAGVLAAVAAQVTERARHAG